MREFKLSDGFFTLLRRGLLIRSVPLIALALGTGLYLGGRQGATPALLVVIVPTMLGLMAFAMWRAVGRHEASLRTFRILLGDDVIRRTQAGYPDIEIARKDVLKIRDIPGHGLILQGPERYQSIAIPEMLEGIEECRAALAGWRASETAEPTFWSRNASTLTGVAMIGGLLVVNLSWDARVVVPVGLALSIVLVWSAWVMRRSPNVDARTRRRAWWVLFVLVWLLVRMYVVVNR
jgi:hypothetical protein